MMQHAFSSPYRAMDNFGGAIARPQTLAGRGESEWPDYLNKHGIGDVASGQSYLTELKLRQPVRCV